MANEVRVLISSRGGKEAADDIKKVGDTAESEGSRISSALGGAFKGLAVGGAALGALGGAVGIVGFNFNQMREQSEIAFGTMLGSGEKAKVFLDSLQDFAAKTPFEFPELTDAAQRMLAMGFAAEDVIPTLTAVGDAAAALGGSGELVDGITTALGQMRAKGKTTAEEMNQLTERGVPAWQMLADKIGTSVPEAMAMVSKGAIDADTTIAAVVEGSNQRFAGMMDKQSRTFGGLLSTIKDTFQIAAGTVTAPLFDAATRGLQALSDAMASASFRDAVNNIAQGIGNAAQRAGEFAQQFGPPVLGAMEAVAGFVTDKLAPALADFLGQDVMPKVEAFAGLWKDDILPPLKDLGETVLPKVKEALADSVGWLADHKEVLGGVAVAIGVGLTAAFTSWAIAAGAAAISTVAALAPVIAVGVAIAALAAGVIWLVKNWDDLEKKYPLVKAASDNFRAGLEAVKDFITDTLAPALQSLAGWFDDHVLPALRAVGDFIANTLGPRLLELGSWIGENVVPKVVEFGTKFAELHKKLAEEIVPPILALIQGIGDTVFDAALSVGTWLGAMQDVFIRVKDALSEPISTLVGWIKGIGDAAKDALDLLGKIPGAGAIGAVTGGALGTVVGGPVGGAIGFVAGGGGGGGAAAVPTGAYGNPLVWDAAANAWVYPWEVGQFGTGPRAQFGGKDLVHDTAVRAWEQGLGPYPTYTGGREAQATTVIIQVDGATIAEAVARHEARAY